MPGLMAMRSALSVTWWATGKRHQLAAGEHPRQVAHRLTCEAIFERNQFKHYDPLGIA